MQWIDMAVIHEENGAVFRQHGYGDNVMVDIYMFHICCRRVAT